MTRDQYERWRDRLLDERGLAAAAVASADRDLRSAYESGDLEAAHDGEEEFGRTIELGTAVAQRGAAEIQAIDAALERLERDPAHFGICEECGMPINEARLDMVPWTRRCRAHAARAFD